MLYSVSMYREKEKKRRRRILYETIRTSLATLLLLAAGLLTFAWFHHAGPKQRTSAGLVTVTPTPAAVVLQADMAKVVASNQGILVSLNAMAEAIVIIR